MEFATRGWVMREVSEIHRQKKSEGITKWMQTRYRTKPSVRVDIWYYKVAIQDHFCDSFKGRMSRLTSMNYRIQ